MSEVAHVTPNVLVVPGTGEIVPLDQPLPVAHALHTLRLHKSMVEEARGILEATLVDESIRLGTKTIRMEGMTATVGTDTETEWDVTTLIDLLEAGLPEARYNDLVQTQVTYKVSASVANQISGANPEYKKIIDRARVKVPKRPSVRTELK